MIGRSAGTIDRPDLLRENRGTIILTEAGFGGTEQKPDKKLGGGNYRVILLDDPKHTEELVVQAITTVLSGHRGQSCQELALSPHESLEQPSSSAVSRSTQSFTENRSSRMGCRTKIEPDTATI